MLPGPSIEAPERDDELEEVDRREEIEEDTFWTRPGTAASMEALCAAHARETNLSYSASCPA